MRIGRHVGATSQALQLMAEIASAAAATGPTGRVCGEGCSRVCETCGSRGCQCECGPDCSDAARALSSQPSAYPIESGIVPLVYAFARTGLLHSCWSCEGHNHADGSALARTWRVTAMPSSFGISPSMISRLNRLRDAISRDSAGSTQVRTVQRRGKRTPLAG
jgi:hypothetical protein